MFRCSSASILLAIHVGCRIKIQYATGASPFLMGKRVEFPALGRWREAKTDLQTIFSTN
jgi:hypothetical protein